MRLISRLLLVMSAMIVIIVVASFFLPQKQHVERSIDISAPAEKIYPYLANPKLFGEWSPWSKIDPDMKVEYIGPASGVGAGMKWVSEDPSVGTGNWIIKEAVENQSLNVDMDFGEQGGATSFFKIQENSGKQKVTWGFDTDAGMNPVMRWVGLLMDKMVGTEYEKGLLELKEIVEK